MTKRKVLQQFLQVFKAKNIDISKQNKVFYKFLP